METKKNKWGKNRVNRFFCMLLIVFVVAPNIKCSKDDGPNGPSVNTVSVKSMSPQSPSTLKFDEEVTITYDYEISDPIGVRIWLQPYTNGSKTPKFSYTSSPLIKGSGSRTVTISVTSGNTTLVDQVLIKIADAEGKQILSESFQTVNYTFTN